MQKINKCGPQSADIMLRGPYVRSIIIRAARDQSLSRTAQRKSRVRQTELLLYNTTPGDHRTVSWRAFASLRRVTCQVFERSPEKGAIDLSTLLLRFRVFRNNAGRRTAHGCNYHKPQDAAGKRKPQSRPLYALTPPKEETRFPPRVPSRREPPS